MSNSKDIISVIIPAYNAGNSISKTLLSIINQTYKELEFIVVNDGSTDNTLAIVQRYSQLDSRIKVVNLEKNKGVHEARIRGLRESTGQWIGFIDADDTIKPNMYEKLLNASLESNSDIVICGAERVDEEGKVIKKAVGFKKNRVIKENVFELFCDFKFGSGSLWNKLYKRDVVFQYLEYATFPWRQKINEDLILNSLFFYQAKSVCIIKDSLYNYSFNNESVTTNIAKAEAFTYTVQALAIIINIFIKLDSSVINEVIELYRKQLDYGSYGIGNLEDLDLYQKELNEALSLINRHYPLALAKVIARKRFKSVGVSELPSIFINILKERFNRL